MKTSKQALAVLATVIIILLIYIFYTIISDKLTNTYYIVNFITYSDTEIPSQQVKINRKVEKPVDPYKEGYKFLYWYDANGEYNFDERVKSNKTLKARWEEIKLI